MPSKKKLQVFISSTYSDLKQERQAAVEAILKAGHIPAGMELFAAGSESQLEIIRRWIDESDVYMLILGGRYGTVEAKTALSYTELEYDYAVSKDKPFFAVVITEEALNKKIKKEGKDVLETENPKELKLFREKVLGKISSFFADPKDIKLAVHETLADFQARYKFTGWVAGSEVPEVTALLDEIKKLRVERDEALLQLTEVRAVTEKQTTKTTTKWSEEEFKELVEAFEKMEISTKVFNKPGQEKPLKVPILYILDVLRDTLITGVRNSMNASDIETLLYYNVCPKLEIHELASIEKVPGVAWQRYRLTAKGRALLLYFDKHKPAEQPKAQGEPRTGPTPLVAKKKPVRAAKARRKK